MLKRINPEDLVEGKECYIKVVTEKVKTSDGRPVLRDIAGNLYYPSNGEPIYTLEDQPHHPDPELTMLVNVASRLYSDYMTAITHGNISVFPPNSQIAREAAEIIAACKNALKQQP